MLHPTGDVSHHCCCFPELVDEPAGVRSERDGEVNRARVS